MENNKRNKTDIPSRSSVIKNVDETEDDSGKELFKDYLNSLREIYMKLSIVSVNMPFESIWDDVEEERPYYFSVLHNILGYVNSILDTSKYLKSSTEKVAIKLVKQTQ